MLWLEFLSEEKKAEEAGMLLVKIMFLAGTERKLNYLVARRVA